MDASHATDSQDAGRVRGVGIRQAGADISSARSSAGAPSSAMRGVPMTSERAPGSSTADTQSSSRQPSPVDAKYGVPGTAQARPLSPSEDAASLAGRPAARIAKSTRGDLLVLESCHSTWLFDRAKMRFRRILKGLDLDVHQASTGWRDYFGIELDSDSESFVVLLNRSGTRLLRSWRHVENCKQCGTESTAEISLTELREASGT